MQPEKRDAGYLWDMLEAARNALEFRDDQSSLLPPEDRGQYALADILNLYFATYNSSLSSLVVQGG